MNDHNHASCDDPLCRRCERSSASYVDGKSKALFEVSPQTSDHPTGCGCDPCQAVAERLRRRANLQGTADTGRRTERSGNALPDGLRAELALILGIELSDGDLL